MRDRIIVFIVLVTIIFTIACRSSKENGGNTIVSFKGENIYINNEITLKGRNLDGISLEGLLPNSRMVQGIFDDLNPETRERWAYADTEEWNPDRNTNEFVAAMSDWRDHGLLSFTLNLQGGSPHGYSRVQPWYNSAFTAKGELRKDYMNRLEKIIDKANDLNMVVILGLFYFGQDERLENETAIIQAVKNTVNWLFDKNYRNVMIELVNECNNPKYDHEILKADRVHELIKLVQSIEKNGYRYYVSTSYNGNSIPGSNVVKSADYILLHGNGVHDPDRITEMVELVRGMDEYRPMPIIFNEDDHFDFDKESNNMLNAFRARASWGYFDFRALKGQRGAEIDEPFEEGFQSVPVDWKINSERKKAFFKKVKDISGIN